MRLSLPGDYAGMNTHTHIITADQNRTYRQTIDVLGLVTWSPLLQEFPRRRWPHSKATASSALNSAHRAAVKYEQVHFNHDNRYIGSHNDPHHMYAPTTVPWCLSLRLLLMIDFASYPGSSTHNEQGYAQLRVTIRPCTVTLRQLDACPLS